jgi:nitrite reductase/ring-hydroxylating ferredoxin subunit
MAHVFVCRDGDLPNGSMRIVAAGEMTIGVYRQGGRYFAYRNLCMHQGGPACEGIIVPKVVDVLDEDRGFVRQGFLEDELHIVCPWHGWEYKLETGVCAHHPGYRLQRFDVEIRDGGDVYVAL